MLAAFAGLVVGVEVGVAVFVCSDWTEPADRSKVDMFEEYEESISRMLPLSLPVNGVSGGGGGRAEHECR